MIRRTFDFVDLENKSVWDNTIMAVDYQNLQLRDTKWIEWEVQKLEKLLSYFQKAIENYPEILTDEQIRKDSERLIAYCKKKGVPYKDTYSYLHYEKTREPNTLGATIGLKISNLKFHDDYALDRNVVDIAYYAYTKKGTVQNKKKLRLSMVGEGNIITASHLLEENSTTALLYEGKTLARLKPYIKIKN